jgi:Tfp pilus assembly protein PilE
MTTRSTDGFTLIEVILVCIIGALLGIMMVQFIRTSTLNAVRPAIGFNTQTELHSAMERITTEYKRLIKTTDPEQFNLGLLKSFIDTESTVHPFVSSSQTGFITFSSSGTKTYSASSISQSQGSSSVLLVTLVKDDQSLRSLFVD